MSASSRVASAVKKNGSGEKKELGCWAVGLGQTVLTFFLSDCFILFYFLFTDLKFKQTIQSTKLIQTNTTLHNFELGSVQ